MCTTKNREPLLSSAIRRELFAHILKNCREKNIYLDCIGDWSDHVHFLISLGREQHIAKVMMLIKGESAHWINGRGLLRGKFHWQDDYYAISVSESLLDRTRSYIDRQEEHHKAVPLSRELESIGALFVQ